MSNSPSYMMLVSEVPAQARCFFPSQKELSAEYLAGMLLNMMDEGYILDMMLAIVL